MAVPSARDFPIADLTRSITFNIDSSSDALLSSPPTKNTEEELSIPREIIAEAVSSTRLQAELERPIRVGTYNNYPAWLLCFRFSFQRTSDRWLTRVQAAKIEIGFFDAPWDASTAMNPSVVQFYPIEYEGRTTSGQVVHKADASLTVAPPSGGPNLGTSFSREVTVPLESKLHVHGVCGGRPARNKVTWTIEEDYIKKDGMPREMRMPIIVMRKEPRRFSARLLITAHYSIIRGPLAKMVPLLGKLDDPLYFDPAALENAMDQKLTGPDGTPIAEKIGILNNVVMAEYSSF